MAKKGKKFLAAAAQVEAKLYSASEAIELLKKVSFENFDASVEFAIRLNLDPRKAEQNLRGAVVLPHGTGKTKRVLVFAQGDKAKEAEEAGAVNNAQALSILMHLLDATLDDVAVALESDRRTVLRTVFPDSPY